MTLAIPNGLDPAAETLAAVRAALASGMSADDLAKATTTQGISTSTGIVAYNLEAPAKNLYPVLTPLRNQTPRQGGGIGTAVNWKAITAINAAGLKPGVAEGAIGTVLSVTEADRLAAYKTLGYPNTVTFEAIQAGRTFDDVMALASVETLQATMIGEERSILGGNVTAIAKPASVTADDTAADASGSLSASTTYDYGVSALTTFGYLAGATGQVAAVDAPDETDARTGSHATTASGAGSDAIHFVWPAVRGAVAYNIYAAAASGTKKYVATVFTNEYTLLAIPGSGHAPNAADQTADSLDFDGMIAQISVASGGGYWKDMAHTQLTADGAGGVVQIDTALQSLWDTSRVGPTDMWVNSQEALTIGQLILSNGSASGASRFVQNVGPDGSVRGGWIATEYRNKFFGDGAPLKIRIHPDLAPGTILLPLNGALPYPTSNVPSAWVMDVRQEYTQYDFAQTDRQKRIGVYVSEVLKGYFPAGNAVITAIKAGHA